MYAKVAKTIAENGLLAPGANVVIGVSGGADSLCLLDCLIKLGYAVYAAHLDHQLRPESSQEAIVVQSICDRYGVPFSSEAIDVRELAQAGGSVEELARLVRYNFLARVAERHGIGQIAVGHTADDQVETVIMHLLRGAGPSGLRGMKPKTRFTAWVGIESASDLDLIRPLLDLTRVDTLAHCESAGLVPIADPSNLDPTFYRNRIRHELLPILEQYNPGIRQVILRLAEVMRDQVDFNQDQLMAVWSDVVKEAGPDGLIIKRAAFTDLHPYLQSMLVRHMIARLAPTLRDISYEATMGAVAWMNALEGPDSLALPGQLSLERYGADACLRRAGHTIEQSDYPQLLPGSEISLEVPGELMLENGWRIAAQIVPDNIDQRKEWFRSADASLAVFQAGKIKGEIRVRGRVPGDRLKLPGMEGTTKIADLMINRKIPTHVRNHWPLVVVNDEIIWVPGLHRSEHWMLEGDAGEVLLMQLVPPHEVDHDETAL